MSRMSFFLISCLSMTSLGCLRGLDLDLDTPCSRLDCDDGNSCTRDSCANYLDVFNTGMSGPICEYEPANDGQGCGSDGFTCGGGLCGAARLCEGVVCRDDDLCTDDTCAWDGKCVFAPVVCDDDDFCTEDQCDPGTGRCDFATSAADGTFCLLDQETFAGGGCEAGLCIGPCDPESQEEQTCPVEHPFALKCCPGTESCVPDCGI